MNLKLTSAPLVAALPAAILLLPGCCLKSVTLKPSVTALDVKAAKAGSFGLEVPFEFKDCCPSKEQKQMALDLQRKVANLYNELIQKPNPTQQDIDAFDKKQKLAASAISTVILVCSAVNQAQNPAAPAPATPSTTATTGTTPQQPQVQQTPRPATKAAAAYLRRPLHHATEQDLDAAWRRLKRVADSL